MKTNLAILAGGFGTRLKEITKKIPKLLSDENFLFILCQLKLIFNGNYIQKI